MAYVLGIDLGTSSTKTLLLSEDGRTVAKATADYPLSTPQPNWVEQDPAAWWEAVCSTVRQVLAAWSGNPRDIAGVGLSGQMNGAVFLNAQGRPLRPAILWLDHRSVAECEWAQEQAGEAIRAAALNPPQPVYSAAKLLWVQRHEPEVWQQARVFLEPKDYVNFLLTGRLGTELTDASATLLLDLRTRQWAVEVWEPLGIRPDLLPELTEATAVIGEVTPTAAAATGLAASTPVVSGGADMACMAVGSGVVSPGVVSVTIGTAGHVTTCAPFVSEAGYNKIYPMCHAVPGQYFWLGCVFSGGLSLQWFRDALGQLEVTAAAQEGGDPYDLLCALAEQAPCGSEGLFFLPWLAGSATPHPDGNARGCYLGLTLRHRKPELVRAILEGVAYNLRDSLEVFQELGLELPEVRVGEGGAKSPLWRQILADVFGRDVRLLRTEDASAIGAALIAGVGVGVWPDFATACAATVQLGETTKSNPAVAAQYERYYQVYRRFYDDLRETFRALARLSE